MSACKEIELNGRKLRCYECGKIETFVWNKWKELVGGKVTDKRNGYTSWNIKINYKLYKKHRVIAYAFLGLDIDNPNQVIDHIDHDTNNNDIYNLRVVSQQQNNWNTNAKGYIWCNQRNKWKSYININYKHIWLGYFDTEDEAHQAYLTAKEKYHVI